MNEIDTYNTRLMGKADAACQRIAPLWPLKSFVAVNPYFGLRDQSFWQADKTLERIAGVGLCMPRAYYQEQIASGRITRTDLAAALRELGSTWNLPALEQALAGEAPAPAAPLALVTDVLSEIDHKDWSNFVVERISQYCAAYFDEGQALWPMPWRDKSLYRGWLEYTRIDKSPWMMGVRGMDEATAALPDTAQGAIAWALRQLAVPPAAVDDYLHATLLSVGGWAGWARYQRWQAELKKGNDDSLRDLLAIRLAWDALLYKLCYSEALKTRWQQAILTITKPVDHADAAQQLDAVLQTAFEIGYQRQLVTALTTNGTAERSGRAAVQAVFCIDVRSEIYRRALETVAPSVQTLGFAGFFGVLMEYVPFGAAEAKSHLPILFDPPYRICERPHGADAREAGELIVRRHTRMRTANAWKTFKTSASSCFSFVEATGLLFAPKLVSDSMGWSRPVPHPDSKGLDAEVYGRLGPVLPPAAAGSGGCADGVSTGISEADRPAVAEFALRNMGMIRDFSRLVLLVGHGSTTANNPQATALDCGACAGQTGEASARIAVQLLNDPLTRKGLAKEKGIVIPADTYFIAGLHDTTTDEVHLFDTDDVPSSHTKDLTQLHQWLSLAGQTTRMERAINLGTSDLPPAAITADIWQRTRDWAQVRPEWALAGNAAFIVAPRTRTAHCDLAGRSFLHDYNWHNDTNFATLQLIMTAPMVVGNWINMQYYGSVVDNRRFGSGNKVLHNVVSGSVGVLEGNGGDLRVGLALQSLHDGTRWIHEPMRLNVVIEAPQSAIDDVIARHDLVRELTENAWLHLFQIDEDGSINRRGTDKQWQRMSSDSGTVGNNNGGLF
jgi:uncharacterized protein YbcC (UPF0753/DUF2309 family)